MPSDDNKIVMRVDKTPVGQHAGRFDASTINEVAIVVDAYRSYDTLQYPIIFWQGEDGYDFSIKMINPITVVPRSTPDDKLNACLKSSNLWKHVKVLHLSKNMRVMLQNDQSGDIFSKRLLDIGNGKFPIDMLIGCIIFPESFCQLPQSKAELIQKAFPNVAQNYLFHDWLSERVILAAKKFYVNELNFRIQDDIPGEMRTYKSVDTATNEDDVVNCPVEFSISLDLPGLPPHNLQLKVGSVVIMLPNINQPRLCIDLDLILNVGSGIVLSSDPSLLTVDFTPRLTFNSAIDHVSNPNKVGSKC
ncbi:hypothetical protein EVAR_34655_1 [Eumeta japonica]|uniref:ATP-dependent DNA helicase n=1 Tax=Eumeta variegata TaxID=151549 RepID=A0A4C1VES1_EUMVA|nr:hypothetical protein EVAR_34655_1 [Eumeta japonica]